MILHVLVQNLKLQSKTRPLRHLSDSTGIQLTRLFRIINGSELKAKEIEKISRYLNFDVALLPKDCSFELKFISQNWHQISPCLKESLIHFLQEMQQLAEFTCTEHKSQREIVFLS